MEDRISAAFLKVLNIPTPAPATVETPTPIMKMEERQLLDYYMALCQKLNNSLVGGGASCHLDKEDDKKALELRTFHVVWPSCTLWE